MEQKGLQVFSFQNKQVRVVMKDNEPWWVVNDVCDILEHTNSRRAVDGLDDDEKGVTKGYTLGGEHSMTEISESGLYTLIMRSNKPEAKKFRKWVTAEVLPTIRKTGGYNGKNTEFIKCEAALKRADAMLNNSRLRIAKFIRETVKDNDVWELLSSEAKQAYSAYVTETATGQPGLIPLPVVEKTYTATELGEEFGVSAWMVGHVANENEIKTSEYGIEVLDKAKGHDKQIPTFRYNEKGRERLRILIQAKKAANG